MRPPRRPFASPPTLASFGLFVFLQAAGGGLDCGDDDPTWEDEGPCDNPTYDGCSTDCDGVADQCLDGQTSCGEQGALYVCENGEWEEDDDCFGVCIDDGEGNAYCEENPA